MVSKPCSFCSLSFQKARLGQLITAQVPEHGHFWGIKVSPLIASLGFSASGAVPEQTLEEGGQHAAGQLCGCLGTPKSKNLTEEVEQTSQAGVISQTLSMACEKLGQKKKSMKMDKPLH